KQLAEHLCPWLRIPLSSRIFCLPKSPVNSRQKQHLRVKVDGRTLWHSRCSAWQFTIAALPVRSLSHCHRAKEQDKTMKNKYPRRCSVRFFSISGFLRGLAFTKRAAAVGFSA